MKPAATNSVLFERANIRVTDNRFETGVNSFPIKKISSIKVKFEKRQTRIGIPLAAGGVAALLGGALTNFPLLIVAGAAFTVGGAILCFTKPNGVVILTMRGRDVRAMSSKDATLLEAITAALHTAIARRS